MYPLKTGGPSVWRKALFPDFPERILKWLKTGSQLYGQVSRICMFSWLHMIRQWLIMKVQVAHGAVNMFESMQDMWRNTSCMFLSNKKPNQFSCYFWAISYALVKPFLSSEAQPCLNHPYFSAFPRSTEAAHLTRQECSLLGQARDS